MRAGRWLLGLLLVGAGASACSVRDSDDDDAYKPDAAPPTGSTDDSGGGGAGATDGGSAKPADSGTGTGTTTDAGAKPDSATPPPPTDAGAAPDTAPPPPPADASVPDDLAAMVVGTYAMKVHVESIAKIPILGDQKSTTNTYAQVNIQRSGATELTTTEVGCHVDIIGDPNTKTVVPDAIPKSVPAIVTPFVVFRDATTVRFSRAENPISVGVKLADPVNDALPTSASDTRIWDQDNDSNPGITIKLQGTVNADLYAVQRPRSSISGTVSDAGMGGLVVDRTDQYVFAAKPATYKSNPTSVTYPDPSKNTVQFARIAATDDCTAIMNNITVLFP